MGPGDRPAELEFYVNFSKFSWRELRARLGLSAITVRYRVASIRLMRRVMTRGVLLSVKIIVAVVLLGYVLVNVPISEILRAVASADPTLFALAMGVVLLDQYLGACQLRLLASALHLPFSASTIFRINIITAFYQLFLPGSLSGGVAKGYMLGKPGQQYPIAFACIVFNRLVENITLIVAGTICWYLSTSPQFGKHAGVLLVAFLGSLITVYVALFTQMTIPVFLRRAGRSIVNILPDVVAVLIQSVNAQLARARPFPVHLHCFVFGLSLTRQAIGIFGFYWLALSLALPIDMLELGWMRSIVQLVTQLPISIAGLGIREATLLGLLPLYGVVPSAAVAFAFLLLARILILGIGGGLLEARYRLVWSQR